MSTTHILGMVAAACLVGCSPLLDADFDDLPAGILANGTVNLPGSPSGDQMVVSSRDGSITIEGGVFEQKHLRIPTGDPAPAVRFRPVRGNTDARIFITYAALLTGAAARGRIIFHNLDDDGAPDDVPDMTLDFVPQAPQPGEPPVTPTGWKMNGIVGQHSVLLAISPDGGDHTATVAGDEIASSPNVFQFSSVDGGWRANPPRFEITLTTDPDAGAGAYEIDDLLITEN